VDELAHALYLDLRPAESRTIGLFDRGKKRLKLRFTRRR